MISLTPEKRKSFIIEEYIQEQEQKGYINCREYHSHHYSRYIQDFPHPEYRRK